MADRRFLLVSINYWPELTGIGKYNGEMAAWLRRQGCSVRVITAPPYYPQWQVGGGYSAFSYSSGDADGVHVVRCPLWVPARPTGLRRILHLLSFALSSFPVLVWQALSWRPDVVFVVEPPLFCAFGAALSARLCRARAWLHIQDFEVDAAFDLGILKSERAARAARAVEHWLMRRFDTVSTISQKMLERLAAKGVPAQRQLLFENWVDDAVVYPLQESSAMRSELGISAHVNILLYSGNFGKKQGIEIIVQAAERLRERDDILFVLCGAGAAQEDLKTLAGQLDNIIFLPLQPIEKLNEMLNMADIHLLPQRADVADLVMPSKLSNMMASGRPVIATAGLDTQVGAVVSQCGMVVAPGDVAGFVAAIETLVADPVERARLGASAREIVLRRWQRDRVLSTVFSGLLQQERKL